MSDTSVICRVSYFQIQSAILRSDPDSRYFIKWRGRDMTT